MDVKVVDKVGADLLDEAWTLYFDAFEELNTLAVQRHLMWRWEFDDVMADARIRKYLALDDTGRLVGLSAYTNDLHAVPLISPAYFRRHYPAEYAAGQVWYCEFVAVTRSGKDQPDGGAFAALVEAMWRDANGGIIALDMCRINADVRGMSRVVPLMLHRLAGEVRTERADEQSYWIYEFPGDVN
jgi:hypothetical protein